MPTSHKAVVPCCIPSVRHLNTLQASIANSLDRPRAGTGSLQNMVRLDGGPFLMGSEAQDSFPKDGEGPVRQVDLSPFYLSKFAVTNGDFAEFVKASGYRTEAERFGWSFVFRNQVQSHTGQHSPEAPWFVRVNGACWSHPEGPESSIESRTDYPVVHVTWNDAAAYCAAMGYRVPTEAEWEYASRGGLEQNEFSWGNEFQPNGRHMCNTFQGVFPNMDTGEDGWIGTAPVNSFNPNGFGLLNTLGNTWEWCGDFFHPTWHLSATQSDPIGPPSGTSRVIKGGSYLCHESYCRRYRNPARTGNTPDTSSCHVGFRVARDL